MMPEYKKVKKKAIAPHCPKCKEKLHGYGSVRRPYKCSCGIWEYVFSEVAFGEYQIKK